MTPGFKLVLLLIAVFFVAKTFVGWRVLRLHRRRTLTARPPSNPE